MTFLAPIAGLIAAGVVLPPLLLFYMLKLRRRPVRVSSTMLWEQAAKDLQANVPLRWLRPSWLLLLQLLAVGAFIVAVARPAIEGAGPLAGRVLLVVDASASMAAPAGAGETDGSRLDDAKARALELVRAADRSADEVEIGVIVMAGEARLLATPTSDRGAVRRAIESIEAVDQPANLEAALNLIAAQLLRAEYGDGAAPTRVVVYSDGAIAPAPADAPGLRNADVQFVRIGPTPDANIAGAPEALNNLGFTTASAVRDFDNPERVRVFARLVSASPVPLSAPVSIRLDGRAVRAATVSIGPSEDGRPGEGLLATEFDAIEGGALTLSIDRADMLGADNTAALRLPRAGAARVLLVSEGRSDPFLERALSAAIGREIEATTMGQYRERARNPNWPASYDLIVFLRAQPDAPPPVGTLTLGAPAPGGIITLAPLENPGATRRLASWRRTHPLLRHVALDQIVVAPVNVLVLPEDERAARVTSLATIAGGPVLAIAQDGPVRRAVVSFAPEESSWPVQVSFAVFVANSVAHLAPGALGAEARAITTSEPMIVRTAPGAVRVTISGPETRSVDVPEGASTVSLGLPTRVGLYSVEGAVGEDATIGVNLFNERESSLATADALELPGGAQRPAATRAQGAQEIWRWFVLAGFVLLTLEWLLYAWRMRI